MEYLKAVEIFPDHLLKEIQQYIQGEMIYIPNRPSQRRKWGESSGAASYYHIRNEEIRKSFREGSVINQLLESYGLSIESIKKIVYSNK